MCTNFVHEFCLHFYVPQAPKETKRKQEELKLHNVERAIIWMQRIPCFYRRVVSILTSGPFLPSAICITF